jgi:hypothetical protein
VIHLEEGALSPGLAFLRLYLADALDGWFSMPNAFDVRDKPDPEGVVGGPSVALVVFPIDLPAWMRIL